MIASRTGSDHTLNAERCFSRLVTVKNTTWTSGTEFAWSSELGALGTRPTRSESFAFSLTEVIRAPDYTAVGPSGGGTVAATIVTSGTTTLPNHTMLVDTIQVGSTTEGGRRSGFPGRFGDHAFHPQPRRREPDREPDPRPDHGGKIHPRIPKAFSSIRAPCSPTRPAAPSPSRWNRALRARRDRLRITVRGCLKK